MDNYGRLAKLIRARVGTRATPIDDPAYAAKLRETYQPAPDEIVAALQGIVPKMGARIVMRPGLDTPGKMQLNGDLLLSPGVTKSKPAIIAHELGHWDLRESQRGLPIWKAEVEADAIAHDVMSRLVPNLADQYGDYSAQYLSKQRWNPYKDDPVQYLEERRPVLQVTSDRIVRLVEQGSLTPKGHWSGNQMMGTGYRDW